MRIITYTFAILLSFAASALANSAVVFHDGASVSYGAIASDVLQLSKDYEILVLDTQHESTTDSVEMYEVSVLPSIIFFDDDGKEIDRIMGVGRKWLERSYQRLNGSNAWRGYRSVVRIKVGGGIGSGVIVNSWPGHTVIISAKHVAGTGDEVSVELFRDSLTEVFEGTTVHESPEGDVSIIVIHNNTQCLPTGVMNVNALIVKEGDPLYSFGCSLGEQPTLQIHRGVSISNNLLRVEGFPHQGRSGGPIYNKRMELVGICYAQNIGINSGWYSDHELTYVTYYEWVEMAKKEIERKEQEAAKA